MQATDLTDTPSEPTDFSIHLAVHPHIYKITHPCIPNDAFWLRYRWTFCPILVCMYVSVSRGRVGEIASNKNRAFQTSNRVHTSVEVSIWSPRLDRSADGGLSQIYSSMALTRGPTRKSHEAGRHTRAGHGHARERGAEGRGQVSYICMSHPPEISGKVETQVHGNPRLVSPRANAAAKVSVQRTASLLPLHEERPWKAWWEGGRQEWESGRARYGQW